MREFLKRLESRYILSFLSLLLACGIAFYDYLSFEPAQETVENEVSLETDFGTIRDDGDKGMPLSETLSPKTLPSQAVSFEETHPHEKLLILGKGDTLQNLLVTAGLEASSAQDAVRAVAKVYNLRALKIGQGIKVKLTKDPHSGLVTLTHMEWRANASQDIILSQKGGLYHVQKQTIELKKSIEGVAGRIQSNFFNAAVKQGAPASLVRTAIQALSYEVNFQHDPKVGNGFALLYEVFRDKNGKVVKYGNLLYAGFAPGGKLKQIYRFEGPSGVNYYNGQGECIVRGFLRSPLNVEKLRITSGYGMRMHPIKAYTRQHKGVDFGAPSGTQVVAAASGVIVKAQYWGDYGLYVSIRHGDYTTAYAHLRKIAANIRPGTRISQGQIIGEVGSTGSATAPHLHYEVHFKGAHINPNTIKMMPTQKMIKKELVRFTTYKKSLDTFIETRPHQAEYVFSIKQPLLVG